MQKTIKALRCYEPLVDIEKFSSEFAETFRIWSTISTDGKTKKNLGQPRLDFPNLVRQKIPLFVLKT